MKKIKIMLWLIIISLGLIGCDKNEEKTENYTPDTSFEKEEDEIFSDNDLNSSYDSETSIKILLNGDSISCNSNKVKIETNIVTILEEGTFVISGSLNNGSIIVDSKDIDKPHLILDGVSIKNDDFASIYIKKADKVFITLTENSINTLSNTIGFTQIDDNNVDGVIFSKEDITINGNGTLNVISSGNGIVCKDDLIFAGGNYILDSQKHGLDTNDSIRITNSNITINSKGDGIHCENSDDETLGNIYIFSGTINIDANDDAISSSSTIQIEDGNFNLKTEVSSASDNTSLKGIKATSTILINSGNFNINSYDDAVHSNSSIVINGGNFEVSTKDDGFHADETLEINDGVINILKSYEGLEALKVYIKGGEINLIATDDGINAAGGNDSSGFDNPGMQGGPGGGRPGGPGGRPGDNFGGGMGHSSGEGYIEISGGNIYIEASGDGIDANGDLLITGGITYVCGPTQGDTAVLDYDNSGKIAGGEFYGSGSSMMAQTLTGENQGVIGVKVGNISANTQITITDSKGNVVAEFTPQLSFQIIVVSNEKIIKGETYTITIGSTIGDIKAQ